MRKNKPQSKVPLPPPGLIKAMHMTSSQMHAHCTPKMKIIRENKGEFRQRKGEKGKTEIALFAEDAKAFCGEHQ